MNAAFKNSLYLLIVSSLSLFGFSIFFFIVGPVDFVQDSLNLVISSCILAFFFVTSSIINLVNHKKKLEAYDERDNSIISNANIYGFVITMMYVFVFTTSLFIKFRDLEYVSVGYLWFIAYSSIIFSYFSISLLIVVTYLGEKN
ncbi:hypothetical protein CI105_02655 [Candidatus Izimaplasma bacterium ZiA1]|uniref:hypothetical protein n=1 Tax=Candidatus Izimoplasma sp. ZiA1 TaxID=2024899 RepID=UPI000BAA485E|nr:hypothetical protein CI105_02655 [Candidatus Izimaplasma bacterium ZiA1]